MLLDGMRLLDLSYGMPPGTMCAHLLADMGMDVIKVEAPGPGRVPGHRANERERAFDSHNRNKRSIVLNLKKPEARDAFYGLSRTADALLECYRPGVAKRLGIDYDTIHAINEQLAYCSLSGFGQTGPYAQLGSHDYEASAMRGAFLEIDADHAITPADCGILFSDIAGGLHAAIGILGALVARPRLGRGTYVDVALTDSVSSFNLIALQEALSGIARQSTPILDITMLKCKDGKFLVQGNTEPTNWARFCEVIGRPELTGFAEADAATRERWMAEIRAVMLTRTSADWFQAITAAGASAALCLTPAEVVNDPQVGARELIWEIDHPTEGKVRQWGSPLKFRDGLAEFRSFAPEPGQHTREVLADLGYSAADIAVITE